MLRWRWRGGSIVDFATGGGGMKRRRRMMMMSIEPTFLMGFFLFLF